MKQIKIIPGSQILIFFIIAMIFSSCNKNEEIGSIVQPSQNLLGVIFQNSIPITAHTLLEDSVRTDETILNLIGSYKDSIFGTTTTGMYAQFRLTSSTVNFGTNPLCDSIILTLAYSGGFYGDTSSKMTLNVYEISESFDINNNYYSNQRLGIFKNDLANYTFKPDLVDSVKEDSTMYAAHLRVKLKKSLGDKVIGASGSSDLADNPSFLSFFKGLYITTKKVSSKGSILYINSLSSLSRLTLYYHSDADTLQHSYNLLIDANSARFNTFDHDSYTYATDTLKKQILKGDTALGDKKLYLQAMAGTKIRVKFPKAVDSTFFENTPLNKIAINKAELVLNVDQTTINTLGPPSVLSLVVINNDGTYSFLPDVVYGESYFGGTYSSLTHQYRFNISKYLQNALLNRSFDDKGLYIVVSGAAVKGDRAVIYGPKSTEGNMRLEVIYTKLK